MGSQRVQRFFVQNLLLAAGVACVAALPVQGQTQQIPAGTTGSLSSNSSTKPGTKQKKILHDALTPKTRATLQAAMDANPDVH
jgi:hypothetical protein